jgi:hypothetical protein
MIMNRITLIFTLFMVASNASLNAQCKAFAKKTCLPELGPFTHDGNYHAAVLVEGEEAELYKTFYSDMEYRVIFCGEEKVSNLEFKILDINKNVIYTNKVEDLAKKWDFKLESSQQLKLVVKVPPPNKQGESPTSGCVSIIFGFKTKR